MGVNDPGNYNQYAALTNQRAAQWAARGATTYFVSVNPVWENPYVTQEQVELFKGKENTIIIHMGSQRRTVSLPTSLSGAELLGAEFGDGCLIVRFRRE